MVGKIVFGLRLSFLRKQEFSFFNGFWTPAFAGVTAQESFSATCQSGDFKEESEEERKHAGE